MSTTTATELKTLTPAQVEAIVKAVNNYQPHDILDSRECDYIDHSEVFELEFVAGDLYVQGMCHFTARCKDSGDGWFEPKEVALYNERQWAEITCVIDEDDDYYNLTPLREYFIC